LSAADDVPITTSDMFHGGREDGDPETGFLDAAGLDEILEGELSRAARHELPVALVMLEVSTNRERLSGDEVSLIAKEVSATIEGRIRGEDHAARLGPLRFAVLAVETGDSATIASDLAAHVRHTLTRSPGHGKNLTVSVGAIDCQFDELTRQELLREVERSLAAAILSGAGVAFPAPSGETHSSSLRSDQRA
jgi:diguanylate cyclase (GGDEF)-like protein